MRKILLAILIIASITGANAQSIIGKYEQSTLVAPDEYRDTERDVVITKDVKSPKKIWVNNLFSNNKFYAVLNTSSDGTVIYAVPQQIVGNYQIKMGCIVYKDHDEDDEDENGKLIISLNNEQNCFGLSQQDYDGGVSVGKRGVKAGNVKVGTNGTVKGGGVDINGSEIKVDTKKIFAGIQYIGQKM